MFACLGLHPPRSTDKASITNACGLTEFLDTARMNNLIGPIADSEFPIFGWFVPCS